MTTPTELQQLLPAIRDISRAAGEAILAVYNQAQAIDVQNKADDSPLTAADLAAHQLICQALAQLTPDIPVLSEEAADIPWSTRQQWTRYWLVDPLDGTKEFIKRNGEFTVNIALIDQGEPVLGVIHAPVLQKTYSAAVGVGAFRETTNANGAWQAEPIHSRKAQPHDIVRIVGSRSHAQPGMDEVLARYPQHELVAVGSSLKFCLVAEGSAQLYPRLGPTMLWDTGAGHVIASVAGARVRYDGIEGPAYHREALCNGNFWVEA